MLKRPPADVAPALAGPAQGPTPRTQAAPRATVDDQLNTQFHAKLIKTKHFRASTFASATAALARLRQKSGG